MLLLYYHFHKINRESGRFIQITFHFTILVTLKVVLHSIKGYNMQMINMRGRVSVCKKLSTLD